MYAVGVDNARKRVTVCFRGMHTFLDALVDVQAFMKNMPNRMKKYNDSLPDEIAVHQGFHNYLFEPIPARQRAKLRNIDMIDGEVFSKFDVCMQQFVLPALKKNPGYDLYVCGHR